MTVVTEVMINYCYGPSFQVLLFDLICLPERRQARSVAE
jgi:hypothetical protein